MTNRCELNLRDLGGIDDVIPKGLFLRSGKLFHHTHALFSFKGGTRDVDNIVGGYQDGQHGMAGGHLKATAVLYTAEIELRPTVSGAIGRKFDPETGTGVPKDVNIMITYA